jgi:hypothetical protein
MTMIQFHIPHMLIITYLRYHVNIMMLLMLLHRLPCMSSFDPQSMEYLSSVDRYDALVDMPIARWGHTSAHLLSYIMYIASFRWIKFYDAIGLISFQTATAPRFLVPYGKNIIVMHKSNRKLLTMQKIR